MDPLKIIYFWIQFTSQVEQPKSANYSTKLYSDKESPLNRSVHIKQEYFLKNVSLYIINYSISSKGFYQYKYPLSYKIRDSIKNHIYIQTYCSYKIVPEFNILFRQESHFNRCLFSRRFQNFEKIKQILNNFKVQLR